MEDKKDEGQAEECVEGQPGVSETKATETPPAIVAMETRNDIDGSAEVKDEAAQNTEAESTKESKEEVKGDSGSKEDEGKVEPAKEAEEPAASERKTGDGEYGGGEEEEEEEEEEDVFAGLSAFTSEVLGAMACPAEPMPPQDRSPRSLSQQPTDIPTTMKLLQDLMTYDEDEPDVSYGPGPCDTDGRLAATSHLLAALVTTLDPQHLRRLASRLMSDSCLWVSRLFRYFESTAYIHEDVREGVVRVSRMLLHTRYPRYGQEGYHALYTRPPVIYTAATVRPGLPQHLSTTLGLGSGCVRVVPSCEEGVGGAVGAGMDTGALARMMAEDAAAHKRPFLVIVNTGGGAVGGVDNVGKVLEVCGVHDAWLHAEGHALAALTLPNTPNLPARVCDSMTLPLSLWLGIPSLPYITLYKAQEASAVQSAGLTALSLHVRLSCLPLWTALMTLGQSGVVSRLQHSFELSQYLQLHLANLARIRLLSPVPPEGEDKAMSIQDLVNKPVSTVQLLETVSGSVVFQYVEEGNTRDKNSEYYDNLNSWLGQVVRRDVGSVALELVQLESAGLVLRWSPLEAPDTQHITTTDLDHLLHSLHHQLEILNATVEQRKTFTELVGSAANLQLVEIPGWAGLGGVRYLAELWSHQDHKAPTQASKEDINALNVHLVSQLKATDSAFSLGEGGDGLNCVRFGMVTSDTDLSELLSLVLSTGREVERSSRFLDQMTDIVRKGIEAATEDLKRENEERLWQEGILRHVPIVGSVYNWFSPPPTQGIKGRMLDLTAGVLESTENIYRYHMQIRHGTAPTRPETKLPPAPSIQTSVTPSAPSPSHSRSSSNTSTLHSHHPHPPADSQEGVKGPVISANGIPAAVQS